MKTNYTIIIPIYNEAHVLPNLINKLKKFSKDGHEILLINDGSTDNTVEILNNNKDDIKYMNVIENKGKGIAIKKGLEIASNDKIVIFDGDMEIDPKCIKNLMILNKQKILIVFLVIDIKLVSILFGILVI